MRKLFTIIVVITAAALAGLPGWALTVNVVDQSGKPVPGASVTINSGQAITADANGVATYEPGKDRGSRCEVVAVADGYAYTRKTANTKDDKPLVLTLAPEKVLKGKIVDENGHPIAGAKLALISFQAYSNSGEGTYVSGSRFERGSGWSEGIIDEVTTGEDGSFALRHLPDPAGLNYFGAYVQITAEGRALIGKSIDAQSAQSLEITLPRECKIEGVLRVPDKSAPVKGGVTLSIPVPEDRNSDGRTAAVKEDGTFSFSKLPPGSYTLILYGVRTNDPNTKQPTGAQANWVLPAVGIELTSDAPKKLDIALSEGVLIKGKVVNTNTGAQFKQAELFVYHPGRPTSGSPKFIGLDKNGEFGFYAVPGEVDISPQAVGEGQDRASFYEEETRPHLTFTAEAGRDKTDVVFKVNPLLSRDARARMGEKPVPADLELTPGTFTLTWDPELTAQYGFRGATNLSGDEAKRKMKKLPKLVSKKPKFYASQLDGKGADGLLLYAIDESKGTGKGYDTVYIDANRNADLTDDKPISARAKPQATTFTPWVEVTSHQGPLTGAHLSNPIPVRITLNTYSGTLYASLSRRGGWKGSIESNKGKIECAVLDTNATGTYGEPTLFNDDFSFPRERGDSLYADINLSGSVLFDYDTPHIMMMQNANIVAGRPYHITASPTGDAITVAPYTGPSGTLVVATDNIAKLDGRITSLALLGKSGYHYFKTYEGSPLTLPIGEYKLERCNLNFKQKGDKEIIFDCAPDEVATVKAGKQTKTQLGGAISARGIEPDKKVVYLPSNSSGTAGWFVDIGDNITVSRISGTGDYNSYYPSFKMLDKSAKPVHTGLARYT